MIYQKMLQKYGTVEALQAEAKEKKEIDQVILDSAKSQDDANKAAIFQEQAIAAEGLNYLNSWIETDEDDLDEGEGYGDRLLSLVVAVADTNKDGDIDDDESEIMNIAQNAMYDYITYKGVSEENAVDLLTEFDNDLAESVRNFLLDKMPDGEDAVLAELDKVVFSENDNESLFDSINSDEVTFDAVYKKRFAIRNGKKVKIRKRISGRVRLTAKQKQAIRKAQRKANTGAAKLKRLKSFRMAKRLGL